VESGSDHGFSYPLRSNNKSLLSVPQSHLRLKGDQAFDIAGSRLWNSLPLELREITSLNVFKTCKNYVCL